MNDRIARRLRRDDRPLPSALVQPHPDRCPQHEADAILQAHQSAVAAGAQGYVDPSTGLFSFTAAHHWQKGHCCGMGCRHCPWLDADERLRSAPPHPRPGGHVDHLGDG